MEEGDLVLVTVETVNPTVTHVKLPNGQEGTIVSSEIAPGRIKHLRQYVVPKKKIVCKVLDASSSHIKLSLRRVNSKEKKEVLQKFKQEQTTEVAFKQILGEKSIQIKEKILKDYQSLIEFVDSARREEQLISKYIPKESIEPFKKIVDKRKKKLELRVHIKLKCLEEDGVKRIKEILKFEEEEISISYVSAGEFKLKLIVDDFKQGKKRLQEILEEIEKRAKKNICEFESKEEK